MFKYLLLALALIPVTGFSALPSPGESEFLLNQGYGASTQLGTQVVSKKVHVLRGQWSYAVAGGASGSLSLRDVDGKAAVIPDNAIVQDCVIDVITAPTSSAYPTVAFSTGQSAGDLKTATAIASVSGLMACVPVGSAATSIKMTADRTPTITITTVSVTATHSLTAGKIDVFIKYILGE